MQSHNKGCTCTAWKVSKSGETVSVDRMLIWPGIESKDFLEGVTRSPKKIVKLKEKHFWRSLSLTDASCESLTNILINKLIVDIFLQIFTAWKVSKYGVFSGPYFPVLELNTEIYAVNLRIQPEYGKIRTRKNSVFGHFSRSVWIMFQSTPSQ